MYYKKATFIIYNIFSIIDKETLVNTKMIIHKYNVQS